MLVVISSGRGPLGAAWSSIRRGRRREDVVRRIVTTMLMSRGPHGADYGESGVASSGGHVVRSRRLWQTDSSSKFDSRGSEKAGIDRWTSVCIHSRGVRTPKEFG
ncbi:hypothetical protein COCNU_07G003040 [Cocos nucifera]|uniref:Uncharacterized protein n=1 Tax=Cocos nucifera TaxID=13894 RepID=A0A8K0IED4_COCNU|nr:hypothetical protein COCNU_07G003040 [Cocos nucifera]